jgi:hypothetical protein
MNLKTITLMYLLLIDTFLTNISTSNQTYLATLYTMTNQANEALLASPSTPYLWMSDVTTFGIGYDLGTDSTHQVTFL